MNDELKVMPEPGIYDVPESKFDVGKAIDMARQRAGDLNDIIAKEQAVKAEARARINACRVELADLQRIINAATPRKRRTKGSES